MDKNVGSIPERVFLKKRNVPIILMSNQLPFLLKKTGPWAERIAPLHFLSHLKNIVEERLILTLWACIEGGHLRCYGAATYF